MEGAFSHADFKHLVNDMNRDSLGVDSAKYTLPSNS